MLKKGDLVQHFKKSSMKDLGHCYIVLETGVIGTEIDGCFTVYQALYGDNKLFMRADNSCVVNVSNREDNKTGQSTRLALITDLELGQLAYEKAVEIGVIIKNDNISNFSDYIERYNKKTS